MLLSLQREDCPVESASERTNEPTFIEEWSRAAVSKAVPSRMVNGRR